MKKVIFGCLLISLASCNENKKTKEIINAAIKKDSIAIGLDKGSKDITGCYMMIIEKDTANMNISVTEDVVTGQLTYNRFEKDRNEGDFTGNIYPNGEIKVWYKFKSEGTVSVRQSVFKIKGNALVEGYGDVDMKHDTVVFKYPTALSYEENHPFIKVDCP
ncbi:MAG: hypothetical protein ABIW38_03520 [Ferruginibacter sp.]